MSASVPITSAQRKFLKKLAHPLQPVVQVGGEGISEGVVRAVDLALTDHELIKVRLGQAYEGPRKEAGAALAETTSSQLCQVIGRIVVLYRARDPKDDRKPRIELP
ncbi:MAG: ribosome assembly RNA-binding protein YhbY [Nannocystaceae bacterium]